MNPARRREMVDREHPSLPIVGQCALLGVSRSSIYYRPQGASEEDLSLMREMDRQYLATPFYGSRRMKVWLERQGIAVSRKRVQRLMRVMGLRAISQGIRCKQTEPVELLGVEYGRAYASCPLSLDLHTGVISVQKSHSQL